VTHVAGVRIPVGAKYFLFAKTFKTRYVAHPASYAMGPGFLFEGSNGQGMKLTTRLHVVPM
jgi:hypothetical protein